MFFKPRPNPNVNETATYLSGFICAYHPEAPGSNPNLLLNCDVKRRKKEKEAEIGQYLKKSGLNLCYAHFMPSDWLTPKIKASNQNA